VLLPVEVPLEVSAMTATTHAIGATMLYGAVLQNWAVRIRSTLATAPAGAQ